MSYDVVNTIDRAKVQGLADHLNERAATYGLTVRYVVIEIVINGISYYRVAVGEQS